MQELMEKYAKTILEVCLKVDVDKPLFISANLERLDFVRIVEKIAYEKGIKDIYFDLSDSIIKHDGLKYLSLEELKEHQYWNKEKWNEYAKKGAAFLMLASETPGLMSDIDPKKLSDISMYAFETRKEFDDLRDKQITPWCIAAVPTESWAKEVFPNSEKPLEELWMKIFEACALTEKNPEALWQNKIDKLKTRAQKLNDLKIKKLIYKNSKGTDFEIELLDKTIWCSGKSTLQNGKEILVNFPTEEIFTSPDYRTANGIVYSSKPLMYHDVKIDNFWIKFENGKVVEFDAESGKDTLKEMIYSSENSDYLGEVALVPNDSPISNTNIVFYETLFDENAACHLALGDSFQECYEGGPEMTKEELNVLGLNKCLNHVDFMIGTNDLSIKGITKNGEEIIIFNEGNFSKIFD